MKKIVQHLFIMLIFMVGILAIGYAQTLASVTGTIVDEHLNPVDATVTVKETGRGIATNAKGLFTLNNVASNATLLITGTAINLIEVKLIGRTNLGVIGVTQKIATIETVVVEASTGYQTLQPNEANGSLVVINKKTLNQQAGTSILNRLDGVTPGLLFNIGKSNSGNSQNKTNITIRGLSTINGPLDPLIVLDGFIYEGSINNINPNDVENVTVLKDAEAASVWGARAGNGVIVITTKKAAFNQRMTVSFNAGAIITQKPDLLSMKQMSSADYIDVEQMLFNEGYFDDRINSQPWLSLTPAVQVFLQRQRGLLSVSDSAAAINKLKSTDSRQQYRDLVYKQALTQQYSVALNGGNATNAYNFSIAYDKNLSELDAKADKVNVRFANSFKPVKALRFDVNVYYTNANSRSGQQPYGSVKPGDRYVPYYSIGGINNETVAVDVQYNSNYTDTAGGGKLLDWKYYPMTDYLHDVTKQTQQEIFSSAGVNYILSKAFNIDLKYQYQQQVNSSERLADIESFYARDLINSFSQVDYVTGLVNYPVPPGGIRTLNNSTVSSHTLRGQLNFNQRFGQHQITAFAGVEQRQVKGKGDGYTSYGYNADPLTIGGVDPINEYPDFLTGNSTTIANTPSSASTLYRFVSMYANALYVFKQRYSLSASTRKDGSNIFGANTNDRWKPLSSIGAGWKISNENFYHVQWLPFLKMKLTYGLNGNVDLSKTALPIAAFVGNDVITNYPFSRIQLLNNPDLRWEQTKQLNAGVEFALKNDRVSGSFDIYHKEGSDLYGPANVDYSATGFTNIVVKNVAATRGRGFDLVLNSVNTRGTLGWSTTLLLSYNKTVTKEYYGSNGDRTTDLLGGGSSIIPVVGKDLYGIVAYRWGGLDAAGNPQGYLDGKPSIDYNAIAAQTGGLNDGHLVYLGSGAPRYFGALSNSINWKQFSVTAAMSYKLGYRFAKSSLSYEALINGGLGHSDYEQRWQKPGDEAFTNVPSFVYPNDYARDNFYRNSSVLVLKGANVRLQYINLSFRPSALNGRKVFKDFECYANVANLGILWRANKEKLDPDYPSIIAPAMSFAFGVRCGF